MPCIMHGTFTAMLVTNLVILIAFTRVLHTQAHVI